MPDPDPVIPVSEADLEHDFTEPSAPPPDERPHRRSLTRTGPDPADPGHLAEDDEWAQIVTNAEGSSS